MLLWNWWLGDSWISLRQNFLETEMVTWENQLVYAYIRERWPEDVSPLLGLLCNQCEVWVREPTPRCRLETTSKTWYSNLTIFRHFVLRIWQIVEFSISVCSNRCKPRGLWKCGLEPHEMLELQSLYTNPAVEHYVAGELLSVQFSLERADPAILNTTRNDN